MNLHIRQVGRDEHALVIGVLSAAAGNLDAKGRTLWHAADISEASVLPHVQAGMYHAAFDDEGIVGVFRFQLDDTYFWPEDTEGIAAYVHKVAVHPRRQGHDLAQVLLRHACHLTREQGRRFLRLDCMGGRPSLRSVYERFGFRHHSDKLLGQQVFHRFEIDVNAMYN